MILRGAVLSGRSHTLVVTWPQQARADATESDIEAGRGASLAAEVLGHGEAIEPATQAPESAEARLTFEQVVAWLAVQDDATRAACAAVLADDLTQVRESARADGLSAGKAAGHEAARRELENGIAALKALIESANQAFEHECRELSETCVDIVAEAFGRIAGTLLATREAAGGAVAQVLRRVKEGREVTIRVSPADLSVMKEHDALLSATLAGRHYCVVPDNRIEAGGCIVESRLGTLDGRFEVQLRELYETLRLAKSAQVETP